MWAGGKRLFQYGPATAIDNRRREAIGIIYGYGPLLLFGARANPTRFSSLPVAAKWPSYYGITEVGGLPNGLLWVSYLRIGMLHLLI